MNMEAAKEINRTIDKILKHVRTLIGNTTNEEVKTNLLSLCDEIGLYKVPMGNVYCREYVEKVLADAEAILVNDDSKLYIVSRSLDHPIKDYDTPFVRRYLEEKGRSKDKEVIFIPTPKQSVNGW